MPRRNRRDRVKDEPRAREAMQAWENRDLICVECFMHEPCEKHDGRRDEALQRIVTRDQELLDRLAR